MRAVGVVISIVALAGSHRLVAQPLTPEDIKKPHMIVLVHAKDEAAGRQAANLAADRLGYAVAPETLRKPATRRVYVGAVVTLQRSRGAGFEVVSYLGDQPDALKALAEGRKYYPGAHMVSVELPKTATEEWIDAPFYRLGILVVGSYRTYDEALRVAKSFSARSGYPYGSRGMIYDKDRGLIWPDDSSDEAWAGRYAARRFDSECDMRRAGPCITVERSEGYEGFAPGLYIVVGGVLGRDPERAERLAAARKIAPDAYVKQTTIYLGCTH